MGTKYVRVRTLVEVSDQSDYGRAKKFHHEDTWSPTSVFVFDGPITDAAQTITVADQFSAIDKVYVENNHASVAFKLTVTIDAAAITMDIAAGESVLLDDVSDANLTANGDGAASSGIIVVWGTGA